MKNFFSYCVLHGGLKKMISLFDFVTIYTKSLILLQFNMNIQDMKEYMNNVASNAIKRYIIDVLKYSEEEYNAYIKETYEIDLKCLINEWIHNIYENIFGHDEITTTDDKFQWLFYRFYWHVNSFKDSYVNETYLLNILDNIFNHIICLK